MPAANPRFRLMLTRPKEPPEDSLVLRALVAAMVLVALAAVIAQGAVDGTTSVAALLLVPIGYTYSYLRRGRPAVLTKVMLAVGMLAALAGFIQAVKGAQSVDDARRPLAALFVWVQVLHSFDVPRRRDLGFSAVSSLILMAQAGALSLGMAYVYFLVPWCGLACGWLFLSTRPRADALARVRSVRRSRPPGRLGRGLAVGRATTAATAAVLFAVGGIFVLLPRLPGAYVALPPFSAEQRTGVPGYDGSVANPGTAPGTDGVTDFSNLGYPGFGDSLDLRARGQLSDRIVMRVRAPQALLWRGQVYDTFDGTSWTASDTETLPVGQGFDESFELPAPVERSPFVDTQPVVATFYVNELQPNVIFAPYAPKQVYFPASTISVDRYLSVRAPILLEPGVVYSVVSDIPETTPDLLRLSPARWDERTVSRYTQLPADLPARDAELAHRITDRRSTVYDKVMAVETWLQHHTEYNLDIPRDPPGVDAVDYFLFERRQGFCEHIASAMTLLLRSVGIPARFVTGFGPGGRNPFTGYFDVRESDAHAWVEVLYPGIGWVPYDPTFGVPPADPGLSGKFILPQVVQAVGRFLSAVVPEPVKNAAMAAGHAIAEAAIALMHAWPFALAVVLLGAGLFVQRRRRRAERALGPPPTGASLAFAQMARTLREAGHPLKEPQTPREYLDELEHGLTADLVRDAELVVRAFERDRFSGESLGEAEIAAAFAASARVRASASRVSS